MTEPVRSGGETGAVELIDVVKMFGDFTAVDKINLTVQPGEFISLLGPSGCGKTTTLRMLAGFEEPTAGELRISGQPVAGIPPHKRDVNTVFQAYGLFPHMTVAENVAYGLRQKGVGRADIGHRVAEALEMVKMRPLAERKPKQLSGGQQQRVALARALVNRPSLLLLDEPLGALDRKLREEMQIELKLLQSQLGITFIFVTHDQEEALSMSDRIAVMLDGRIEQLGDPYTIYEHPDSAFVAGFIGQQNFFSGTAAEGGKVVKAEGLVARSTRQTPELTDGANALAAVRPEAVDILETRPSSTENVLAGTLAGVSHLGDVIQFVVTTGSQKEVLARLPRTKAPRLLPGADVWCQWSADHCHIFTDEQAEFVLADPASELSEVIAGG
ncbi:MAG TPA: ABC transporter ATP-binding protein [Actinomycetes bacterium]|nr:ABC transporter ATP-binding protein [Actinomycetes bacterium]